MTPRKAGRGFEVLGRVPVPVRAAEVWVHPDGKCAYLTTISDRVYAIDVSRPAGAADRRLDDDRRAARQRRDDHRGRQVRRLLAGGRVQPQERHRHLRRERRLPSEADRASTPRRCRAGCTVVTCTRATSTSPTTRPARCGSSTSAIRYQPREVARWQTEQTTEGRYLHDIVVTDGLAYLSYWNDGLVDRSTSATA